MGNFWFGVIEGIVSSLISGLILIGLGVILYKRLRKKQTVDEAIISKELKIQYVVNEFIRIRKKYTKPLTENSFSTQVEQELTDLYGICETIKDLCKQNNIAFDPQLNILMNQIYAHKGVLYCNNHLPVAHEKISVFQRLNQMQIDGIRINKETSKSYYLELYEETEKEIKSLIEKNKFFKNYWKD